MSGFIISRVEVRGTNVAPVSIEFEEGINFIVGPSDTGKSYIIDCIDFVFGSSTPPKDIKESEGYKTFLVEIENIKDRTLSVFKRKIGENNVEYFPETGIDNIGSKSPENLAVNNNVKKKKKLNKILLEKSGFTKQPYIKKNKANETNRLTFRTISQYIYIDEGRIFSEVTPITASTTYNKTHYLNVMKFILTGKDDSNLEKLEKKEEWSNKNAGQSIILEKLILNDKKDLESLKEDFSEEYIENRASDILSNEIKVIEETISGIYDDFFEIEDKINNLNKDNRYNSHLINQFNLLHEQYLSDIERLKFIDEGSYLMDQVTLIKCPECGTNLRYQDVHDHVDNSIQEIKNSTNQEILKIEIDLQELEKTNKTLLENKKDILFKIEKNENKYKELQASLKESLEPKLDNLKEELDKIVNQNFLKNKIANVENRIIYLESLLKDIEEEKFKDKSISTTQETIDTLNQSDFKKLLEENISDIFNENTSRIVFKNYGSQEVDFTINGSDRKSLGKGYRSLINSIFYCTLLIYSRENNRPHPGNIILDSPVLTFKDTLDEEKVPKSSINNFYNFLIDNFINEQVIIIENDFVHTNITGNYNLQEFTGKKKEGRVGFYILEL